jgi:hypothetical protein
LTGISRATLGTLLLSVQLTQYPPPFPRDGATKLVENERVTVWDVTWSKGVRTPMHQHRLPAVGVVITPGQVVMTMGDGTSRAAPLNQQSQVLYSNPGMTHAEEGHSVTPARAIIAELKGGEPAGSLAGPADVPLAFPRVGAAKLLENDRVAVWEVTWPSPEAPLHFHARDVVVVGIDAGTTRSLPRDGQPTIFEWHQGEVRFSRRGLVHREEVVSGKPRVITIELK